MGGIDADPTVSEEVASSPVDAISLCMLLLRVTGIELGLPLGMVLCMQLCGCHIGWPTLSLSGHAGGGLTCSAQGIVTGLMYVLDLFGFGNYYWSYVCT